MLSTKKDCTYYYDYIMWAYFLFASYLLVSPDFLVSMCKI